MPTTTPSNAQPDQDPFADPLFGPSGWTDDLVELLAERGLPDPDSSWTEFYAAPVTTIDMLTITIEATQLRHGFAQWDYLFTEPAQLARDLQDATGRPVLCSGKVVRPPRSDERIEITELRLPVDPPATDQTTVLAGRILNTYPDDYVPTLDRAPTGETYLVVYTPRER